MTQKQCTRCGEHKDLSLFKQDSRYASGYSSYCKACHQAYTVAWQVANKDRVNSKRKERYARKKDEINATRRESYTTEKSSWGRRAYLYKISKQQYLGLLNDQDGRCAICGQRADELSRPLHVDHDHNCCPTTPTCGKCNRGLLCHVCNTGLHAMETKPNWAAKATSYLEGHK